jgi:crotonobetainyl-CoA:carnitine CoA-transferase CaiB-like acyl-CoA transferase
MELANRGAREWLERTLDEADVVIEMLRPA